MNCRLAYRRSVAWARMLTHKGKVTLVGRTKGTVVRLHLVRVWFRGHWVVPAQLVGLSLAAAAVSLAVYHPAVWAASAAGWFLTVGVLGELASRPANDPRGRRR